MIQEKSASLEASFSALVASEAIGAFASMAF